MIKSHVSLGFSYHTSGLENFLPMLQAQEKCHVLYQAFQTFPSKMSYSHSVLSWGFTRNSAPARGQQALAVWESGTPGGSEFFESRGLWMGQSQYLTVPGPERSNEWSKNCIPPFFKFIHLAICKQSGPGKEEGNEATMVSRKQVWVPSYPSSGPTAEVGQWWAHPAGA